MTGVVDDRSNCMNGLDEALNNGIDCSPFGNVYTLYGSITRNGVTGGMYNSTHTIAARRRARHPGSPIQSLRRLRSDRSHRWSGKRRICWTLWLGRNGGHVPHGISDHSERGF